MLETRSAVYKMLEIARYERQIDNWPPPFSSDITPYNERNFNTLVRRSCTTKNFSLGISKAIIIGDVSVGKSCLVTRWDTAGQERFKSIAASYYRGANVIIVVFDLSNLLSLGHCEQWFLEAARSNTEPYHVFLVGTKQDLLSNQVYRIIEKRATEVARKLKAEFWAVSSRTGDGVSELFTRVAVLSFHSTVLNALQNVNQKINIGSDLIMVNAQTEKLKREKKKKNKCFDCSSPLIEY
ncbi:ras-related protein Rab-34 isoform X3 [Nomia melanderi]|uniref:ras-related protein Rab-34 isoform X3 n=1 Tax=Nomia melanderi TaxID=2448451 RepID=UPI00130402F3|nr:ras-related protein Rab-34-like isoform X3 [Nomia melanderi]